MTTLVRSNGNLLPTLVRDFFDTDFSLTPSILGLNAGLSRLAATAFPLVNLVENKNDFTIELAAPGLDKKDFKVEIENDVLTVSFEKEKEEEETNGNYRRREFAYQGFRRSFNLPDNSLPEKIEARYNNGILTLTVPKKEVTFSKPKKEIRVS